MEQALIIINAEVNEKGQLISASPVTERMVTALQKGIAKYSPQAEAETTSVGALWSKTGKRADRKAHPVYCPLTIQLPEYFDFSAKKIYSACKDISGRRRWVESKLGFKTSVGDSWLGHLWLPIILTKDKPLFGSIIGEGAIPNYYEQPIDFPLTKLKPLYNLASNLLESLSATPAVYLLQFSLYSNEIVFDRLWPFPATPALASLSGSEIDLYSCHWLCLTEKSIPELEQVNTTMPIF
ncbi:conserved hypothetical protein [Hyella patelloides LEGE 07179]|uniref:Uncharacterized protein n=1 Tax=Hyella patelloides LEGE 07179 TaxID=945734 RepID=A0A563VZB2_9CYAN|nr:hypothetical protein [Hyella patelloides]VEP16707.1 conserved hypothetical protein [Hyella patelloides LEGE 07179]